MTFPLRRIALPAVALLALTAGPAPGQPAKGQPADGARAMAAGRFEQAVAAWTDAAAAARAGGNLPAESEALTQRAAAWRKLGRIGEALADLERARDLAAKAGADGTGTTGRQDAVTAMIGDAYLGLGAADRAMTTLDEAAASTSPRAAAAALNSLGNLRLARNEREAALAAYRRSADLARRLGDPLLGTTALINAARILTTLDRAREAHDTLAAALAMLDSLPDSHDKAFLLIGHALAAMDVPDRNDTTATAALDRAADIARRLDDRRTLAQALGYRGHLHERRGELRDALARTRDALFLAQEAMAPDQLYRWHWQAGRLLWRGGDLAGAIRAYERAVDNLQRVRPDLSRTAGGFGLSFRDVLGPLYLEMTDLLLRRAARAPGTKAAQTDLAAARAVVERLKAAELEDYFQDDCVASLQAKVTGIDRLEPHTAALYPILLPDRTELLVSLGGELRQVTLPVGAAVVGDTAHRLRENLERRTTGRFMPDARQLYDWLIRPLEAELTAQRVDTLVIVPDGPLRGIPLSALHDGQGFLIERYAIAVAPGLGLLEPRPLTVERSQLLLAGLTQGVQGFPALPQVARELDSIEQLYGGSVLKDAQFVEPTVRRQLAEAPYGIVHIASHGKFESNARDSFLLTYDGRLSMDELERFVKLGQFRDEPVELLTLSACQTAAGDDRAALGLAGVAIKAGARSALASLWLINDQASSQLVGDFYRNLSTPGLSRAKALQKAQMAMVRDGRYRHPGYWAPFLLIGSWL